MTRSLGPVALAVVAAFAGVSSALPLVHEAPWAWRLELVDDGSLSLAENRIAVAPDGHAEILYYMTDPATGYNSPWLAAQTGVSWSREVLETAGKPLGLHLSATASQYAYAGSGSSIYWLKRSDTETVRELVLSTAPSLPSQGDLLVDSQGSPHLVLWVPGSGANVRHAYRTAPGVWTTETISTRSDPDAAIDRFDRIHVIIRSSLANGECVYMLRDTDGTWTTEHLTGCGRGLSIAVDSQGDPHVAGGTLQDGFFYMHKNASGWQREVLRDFARTWMITAEWAVCDSSIAIDSQDRPHIAYNHCDNPNNVIDLIHRAHASYAHKSADGWVFQELDPSSNVFFPDIALDAEDRPRVAFTYREFISVSTTRMELGYAEPAAVAAERASAGGP